VRAAAVRAQFGLTADDQEPHVGRGRVAVVDFEPVFTR
jgi:hypothetical protein